MDYPLRFCVWELTLACNMRCLHCGSYAGRVRKDELPLDRALALVDELVDLGLERITLSGGEPLLRKGWEQIAGKLMDRGVRVGMISNGWYLRERLRSIVALKKWDVVAMSLDGLRMTHDAFRRTPGSYDRIVTGFRILRGAGIDTACITCVSRYNLPELDRLHDLLVSVGVKAWQIQPIFVGGRTREYQDMLLGPRELVEVASFMARKRKCSPLEVYPADPLGYCSRFEPYIRPEGWQGCGAGKYLAGIEANGDVKGCLSLLPERRGDNPFVEGNVNRTPLREIWENPENFAYTRRFDPAKAAGFCGTCPHVAGCQCGCTAMTYAATGSIYENPNCLYRELKLNGEEDPRTLVPMTPEFQEELLAYCKETRNRRLQADWALSRARRAALGKNPSPGPQLT
ncbi:MAG: radical SAM protein [Armatimonadetes bacterium]|nr:radical SAM protein [Armatimonadota bacterium]